MSQAQLSFLDPPEIPGGLLWQAGFLSVEEEAALIAQLERQPFKPFEFQGFLGKRETVSFGWSYRFDGSDLTEAAPIPDWLLPVRARAALFAGLAPGALEHALLIRYGEGEGLGWHRDRPVFDDVIGISLLSPAPLRFRRKEGEKWRRFTLEAEPRSIYLLRGPARGEWQHSIPPVATLRYSITFRSMKPPVASAIEDVRADPVRTGKPAAPARRDIIGVVPQDVAGQQPARPGHSDAGHRDRAAPGLRAAVGGRDLAAADEGELGALDDDAAQGRGIAARRRPVQHHLGDRELALDRFAARLEIDGVGEAILLGPAGLGGGQSLDLGLERTRQRRLDAGEAGHVAGERVGESGDGRRAVVQPQRADPGIDRAMVEKSGTRGRGRGARQRRNKERRRGHGRGAKGSHHVVIWLLLAVRPKPNRLAPAARYTPPATPARYNQRAPPAGPALTNQHRCRDAAASWAGDGTSCGTNAGSA